MSVDIAAIIAAYDGQGSHRTGTREDGASASWLLQAVRECGGEAHPQAFALERTEVERAELQAEGIAIPGLPLFDGGRTGADGVAGALAPLGTRSAVGLAEVSVAGDDEAWDTRRRESPHEALVAVTRGGSPGLAPRNADAYATPFGPPVLQVGSEHAGTLQRLAGRRARVRVWAQTHRTPAEAFNVTCTLPGADPALAPLVVMTPRSGWYACASERGGGLAAWLAVLEALVQETEHPLPRTVHFVATSGHELGHLGLGAYLAAHDALLHPPGALWVHLGASIGAAMRPALRMQASDAHLAGLFGECLHEARAPAPEPVPPGSTPVGEALDIHRHGGRYVSLAGRSAVFHLETDRWPEAVNPTAVERYATAVTRLVRRLLAGEGTAG